MKFSAVKTCVSDLKLFELDTVYFIFYAGTTNSHCKINYANFQ